MATCFFFFKSKLVWTTEAFEQHCFNKFIVSESEEMEDIGT